MPPSTLLDTPRSTHSCCSTAPKTPSVPAPVEKPACCGGSHAHGGHTHTPPASTAPAEGITYVCPMDPEVRQSGPGACPKCGMALVPVEKEHGAP